MEVDQKHVTTIRLHDAKGCDIQMVREGSDYHLRLSSPSTVVNLSLGLAEVRRLCQELVQLDLEESWKSQPAPQPESRSVFFNGTPRYFHEAMAHWFARMAAGDVAEKACKR